MSIRSRLNQKRAIVECDVTTTNFAEPDNVESKETDKIDDIFEVPEKYLFGSKLCDILPDYYDRRKGLKNSKEIDYWQGKISSVLRMYDVKTDKYNIRLVKSVCQIVEKYMIYKPKSGEDKKKIVILCCLKYFDDNEALLSAVIEEVILAIDRSTVLMRILAKVEMFFFGK